MVPHFGHRTIWGVIPLPIHPPGPRRPRADAERNRRRLVDAAEAAITRDGANASLEEIARRAGVGSATLHRHFASRRALLEAVFHERIEELCDDARQLAGRSEPGPALANWLRALGAHAATTRGLAATLLPADELTPDSGCQGMVAEAGGALLSRARAAGAIRSDVSIEDLILLVNAVAIAAEQAGDETAAIRLLDVALGGLMPSPVAAREAAT